MLVKKGDILRKTHYDPYRYKVICADKEYAVLCSMYKTITGFWACKQIVNGDCRVINNDETICSLNDQCLKLLGGNE